MTPPLCGRCERKDYPSLRGEAIAPRRHVSRRENQRAPIDQCQLSTAANASCSGISCFTPPTLTDSATAPRSYSTVPATMRPPNTSCFGLMIQPK